MNINPTVFRLFCQGKWLLSIAVELCVCVVLVLPTSRLLLRARPNGLLWLFTLNFHVAAWLYC